MKIHVYADDTQLCVGFKPLEHLTDLKHRIEGCLKELKIWMSGNFLQVNESKTDLLLIGSNDNLEVFDDFLQSVDFSGTNILENNSSYGYSVFSEI